MPFRQKIKKALSRNDSTFLYSIQHETIAGRKDSNIYQPGEAMPVSRHRGPVDPKHKAMLENFTFEANDWRRKSASSLYSPMGSRMPSRNGSIKASHKTYKGGNSHFLQVQEDSDESDDVTNVGGTRNHSIDAENQTHEHQEYVNDLHRSRTANDHTPFTEAELSEALRRAGTKVGATE